MKASKFTDEQKAFFIKQAEDGTPVAEACRKAGISAFRRSSNCASAATTVVSSRSGRSLCAATSGAAATARRQPVLAAGWGASSAPASNPALPPAAVVSTHRCRSRQAWAMSGRPVTSGTMGPGRSARAKA